MSSTVLQEFTKTHTKMLSGFEGEVVTVKEEFLDTEAMAKEIEKLRKRVDVLYDLETIMIEDFVSLEYDLSPRCRCGSCRSFQFLDLDGKVVHYDEGGIESLVKSYMARRATRKAQ